MIKIKRIYDSPADSDGQRILVDRLWPRGISKERAALDEWSKDLAPSPELRQWFDHRQERFDEFRQRYLEELKNNPAARKLKLTQSNITLLYAAKDPEINHARVLKEFLESD